MSIVVRTKDRPSLLREALASIAAQEGARVEAIVVNDGGSAVADVTSDAAPRLAVTYRHLSQPRGRGAAANEGIASCRGHWIGFLDDDDLLLPDGIATLLSAAAGEEVVPYGRVDAHIYEMCGDTPARVRPFQVFDRPFDADALLFENFIPINACLIPAPVLREVGGVDESLECFEDWDLFLRLADRLQFRHVRTPVAEYRIFGEAFIIGRGGQERQHRGRVAVLAKHARRYTPEALSRMQLAVKTEMVRIHESGAAGAERLGAELRERETRLEEVARALRAMEEGRRTAEAHLEHLQKRLGTIEGSRGWKLYQRLRRVLGRP